MQDALAELRPDFTIVLLGRRGSGKSTALKQICYTLNDEFPLVICMTATRENRFYDDFIAPSCLYSGFHERVLLQLIARNRRILDANRGLPKREQTNPAALVILDDCISEREAGGSAALHRIFVAGRHLGPICVILTAQWATSRLYTPTLRANSDLVFCAAQSSAEVSELLVDTWCTGCSEKREALAHFHAVTREKPYQFLVIHSRRAATAKKLSDFTVAFVADIDIPRFRMGDVRYWQGSGAMDPPPAKTMWQRVKSMWEWVTKETDDGKGSDE
jgi:hypothetical protein